MTHIKCVYLVYGILQVYWKYEKTLQEKTLLDQRIEAQYAYSWIQPLSFGDLHMHLHVPTDPTDKPLKSITFGTSF